MDNRNLGESFETFKDRLTPYELFQLQRYGNILRPTSTRCELENGEAESEQFTEWVEKEAEQQLNEMEN